MKKEPNKVKIVYYNNCKMMKIDEKEYSEEEIFLISRDVVFQNKEITITQLYDKNLNRIGIVNETGNIVFEDEYIHKLQQVIGENVDLSNYSISLEEFEKSNLGIELTEATEELDEDRKKEILRVFNPDQEKEETQDNVEEMPDNSEEVKEKMEEDLCIEKEKIRYYSRIIGPEFSERIPQANKYKEIRFIVYSDGSARIAGYKDGKYELVEGIEESIVTHEHTRTISPDGSVVEEKHIKGLMKITGKNDALGYTLNEYGDPVLQELRWDPSNGDYSIAAAIETSREYPRSVKVNDMMKKELNPDVDEEAKKYDELREERGEDAQISADEIEDDELQRTPWRRRMEKT